jgi:large subunit ribosomal protein L24
MRLAKGILGCWRKRRWFMKQKITKGDTVEVIAGNDKGHRGQVQRVILKKRTDGTYDPNKVYVVVAGANMITKHQRRSPSVRTQTGRIEREAPIHVSNVMLVGTDGKPTRAGYQMEGEEKVRIDRRSSDPLPKPK